MTNTPIDRESVERLAKLDQAHTDYILGQFGCSPKISEVSETLLALRAALDAAEEQNKRLRKTADQLADVLNDLLNSRGDCFIPNKIAGRKDWDDDANEALAAYLAQITGETDGNL